ncbi:MAG: 30S ribosomal protein S4 [Candidatus Dormibacteria bacterium]
MSVHTGPVCRFCRREGAKLFLKGERCYTAKCAIERRAFAPGVHGQNRRRKVSDFGIQLRAKQRARRIYGLTEKQFRIYFDRAEREQGMTGFNLLRRLERRLDNTVYRLGFAASRRQARQMVGHRHFEVNGRSTHVPSFEVRSGDVIKVREVSKDHPEVATSLEILGTRPIPKWLSLNAEQLSATVAGEPLREDMDQTIEEHLIVEFYSR